MTRKRLPRQMRARRATKSTWWQERRLDYIDWVMVTCGRLRRADLMRTFGISTPRASLDICEFMRRYPDALKYDYSAREYVPAHLPYRTMRGWAPGAIRAMRELVRSGHPSGWA